MNLLTASAALFSGRSGPFLYRTRAREAGFSGKVDKISENLHKNGMKCTNNECILTDDVIKYLIILILREMRSAHR